MYFVFNNCSGCEKCYATGQAPTPPQKCGQIYKPQRMRGSYPQRKSEALPNSWPWHVGVCSASVGPNPYCGGTLIASKWVLTAAHCIVDVLECRRVMFGQIFDIYDLTGYEMAVIVGAHTVSSRERPSYNVRVTGVIIHPWYARGNFGFDMALLQLNRAVKQSPFVGYACLPEPEFTVPAGTLCYIAGWGLIPNPPYKPIQRLSDNLMELEMPIITTSACKRAYKTMNEHEDVCTDGHFGMACAGDSGGGLHCLNKDGSKWVVYGVYTYGINICFGSHNGFALTTTKVNWIKEVITSHSLWNKL